MAVENWRDSRGFIRNKPLKIRVRCLRCGGTGELDAESHPNGYPVKIMCPECYGYGWTYAKVLVKRLPQEVK
jgi:DnaJ-class molecular chaperone